MTQVPGERDCGAYIGLLHAHAGLRAFIRRLLAFVRSHALIHAGAPVVVAVSGGPDSLALLHALAGLRSELGCELHIAHLDHGLRGAESAAEATFVAESARDWQIPATIEHTSVAARAAALGLNLYAAGRAARYALLGRVAAAIGAQAVAVAHTADDQAETVLMHLLRGAGSEGLSAMRPLVVWDEWRRYGAERIDAPDRPALIRPLLAITRAEVESYCHTQGLEPRHDPSNDDTRHTRSRLRHTTIPHLMTYNSRIVESLGRTAEILASEHDLIDHLLDQSWLALARERPGAIDLERAVWKTMHPALQRAALRRAYTRAGGNATLGLDDIERVRAAARRGSKQVIELPGGVALTIGQARFSLGAPPIPDGPQLLQETSRLDVPGMLALSDGWTIMAGRGAPGSTEGWIIWLAADAGPLLVRRRRPGDRMRPAGGPGSRRIQDLMVDAKLPRELRDNWPLLLAGETIIWAPGIRAAEGCQAAPGDDQQIWVQICEHRR